MSTYIYRNGELERHYSESMVIFKEEPMPEHINGVKLTAKEHRQWKAVNDSAGPAAATAAVKKSIAKRKQKRSGK